MGRAILLYRRLKSALLAGAVAITLNALMLKTADLIELPTAHGGLLRLLCNWFSRPLQYFGISPLWSAVGLVAPNSPIFQTGFHLLVGMMMALFYAFVLEPVLPLSVFAKGIIYAVALWLLNAFVVLPATGEGFAGSAHLSLAGIAWYAAAHTLFVMILAYGFALLMRSPQTIALRFQDRS